MHPVLHRAARPLVAVVVIVAASSCAMQNGTGTGVATPTPVVTAPSTSTPVTSKPTATPTPTPSATTAAVTGDDVVYKVTGSGKAITIDWGPAAADGSGDRLESVPLPWTKDVPDAGKSSIYQVVVIGGDDVGCTITLAGKVVAQEPAGGSGHCIYKP